MYRLARIAVAVLTVSATAAAQDLRFNRDVRPILSDRCFACHGPDRAHRKADLRLDTRDGAAAVLDAADVDHSELWLRITHADADERMPPATSGKQLDPAEIATLRRWLAAGAPYEEHWSRAPLGTPAAPPATDWARGPIDRFIAARLATEGTHPAPDADPTTLARRLHLDLTGLPPTPADVDRFVADARPDRVEHLVDELLASPHHSERMAIWWLDLVRYADTVGYHGDQEHAISPYRDYVLKAFRDDYPFDRFTREQLAGDLLPDATTEQRIASAYNRVLQTTHEGGAQPGEYLAKYAADRVRNLSVVWMGSTLGCAECHDHKYDPFTQRDFYRLAAFFADIDEAKGFGAPNTTPTKRPPEIDVLGPFELEELERIDRALRAEDACDAPDATRRAALVAEREQVAARTRQVMVSVATTPRTVRVLARGNWMDESGEVVEPGTPDVLPPLAVAGRRATRLDLAEWLVTANRAQTARVLVNRLWAQFFGRGLSPSLDDCGSQGNWPSHPELLDWLANDLVEHGWDLRRTIRAIVTSHAYRQASTPRPELGDRDTENAALARQRAWRLPAEFVRDTALAASGLLVDQLGGTSGHPYQPPHYYAHLNFPEREYVPDHGPQQYRRGVYTHWQRMFLHPMLKAFDAPTREECTAERPTSNTPLQALVLLNDPTFVEAARTFAARILRDGGDDDVARLTFAWRTCVARVPSAPELAVLQGLLADHRAEFAADPAAAQALLQVGDAAPPADSDPVELAAWTSIGRTLFNLHETITRS